ncbi:MAG: hypothetical protein U0797_09445 [Gemmataceae bacterium]
MTILDPDVCWTIDPGQFRSKAQLALRRLGGVRGRAGAGRRAG